MKNYTIKETAEIFKSNEETIRRWYRDGKIKGVKAGRKILIREEEIKRLMKECLIIEEKPQVDFKKTYGNKVLVIHPCKKCNFIIKTEKVSRDKVEETLKNGPKICKDCEI